MSNGPKYPNVEVELTEQDGNAFFIIGRTRQALRRGESQRQKWSHSPSKHRAATTTTFSRP